jgi:hypothetical protein
MKVIEPSVISCAYKSTVTLRFVMVDALFSYESAKKTVLASLLNVTLITVKNCVGVGID